ncbi:MAG: hypothetical protein WCC17_03405, partial [Candidatus Nitrosopolaris sp.]
MASSTIISFIGLNSSSLSIDFRDEGEQQKIAHTGNRMKFSVYISMVWPDEKLMAYDFYDKMNST